MLKSACLLAKIGADPAGNELFFAEILTEFVHDVTRPAAPGDGAVHCLLLPTPAYTPLGHKYRSENMSFGHKTQFAKTPVEPWY